jgi:ribonuclease BN (tRNA processing enzyme)
VYGPGEAGLPIPAFPAGRVVPLLFPDAPTPGTRVFTRKLFEAFAYNINVRIADEGRSDVTANIVVHEVGVAHHDYRPDIDLGVAASGSSIAAAAPPMDPVEIHPCDDNGVRVTAILVQHAPVFPALAYRFDTPSGSVVFSGDTGPCDNVVRLAQGADYLVHEVIDLDFVSDRVAKLPNRDGIINHLSASHTSPEDAGRIAARAGVKTLVLSHLVPGDSEIPEEAWEARAASTFDGNVVCGVDLDQFALSS